MRGVAGWRRVTGGDHDEQHGEQPRKAAPIQPDEILEEEFLRPMSITQYRLVKAIGVNARQVHAIVNEERGISAERELLFSRFFGDSAGFWMGLQSQYELEKADDRLSEVLGNVVPDSPAGSASQDMEGQV